MSKRTRQYKRPVSRKRKIQEDEDDEYGLFENKNRPAAAAKRGKVDDSTNNVTLTSTVFRDVLMNVIVPQLQRNTHWRHALSPTEYGYAPWINRPGFACGDSYRSSVLRALRATCRSLRELIPNSHFRFTFTLPSPGKGAQRSEAKLEQRWAPDVREALQIIPGSFGVVRVYVKNWTLFGMFCDMMNKAGDRAPTDVKIVSDWSSLRPQVSERKQIAELLDRTVLYSVTTLRLRLCSTEFIGTARQRSIWTLITDSECFPNLQVVKLHVPLYRRFFGKNYTKILAAIHGFLKLYPTARLCMKYERWATGVDDGELDSLMELEQEIGNPRFAIESKGPRHIPVLLYRPRIYNVNKRK